MAQVKEVRRLQASDFPREVLGLFDKYVHGQIDRRGFMDGAAKFAVGGMTAAAMFEALSPNYLMAHGQEVFFTDERMRGEYVEYASPRGGGMMRGYLAKPAQVTGRLPGVLVIHENRGLNPYVEDVARRFAVANFIAFAPDALAPLGGYPGNDDQGREMQSQRDGAEMTEDFIAGAQFLMDHAECNGQVGAVGFCFGGGMVSTLAVRMPNLGAGAPFYGGQPAPADVAKINAPIQAHYASDDPRINAGIPAFEEALRAANKTFEVHMYEGTGHGFHNYSTPRYNEAAARLAQERTVQFFNQHLRG